MDSLNSAKTPRKAKTRKRTRAQFESSRKQVTKNKKDRPKSVPAKKVEI